MTTHAIFDEGIRIELLRMGFPEPQEMDFIEVNDPSLFFLAFLWEVPPGAGMPFNGLDFIIGCRKVASASRIECISARPVNVVAEFGYQLDVDVVCWDTDGPLPSREIVLNRVLKKILSLTGEASR